MSPNVGVNITCNTNCFQWCPRTVDCCCTKQESSDDEIDREVVEKSEEVAKIALKNPQKSTSDMKSRSCTIL